MVAAALLVVGACVRAQAGYRTEWFAPLEKVAVRALWNDSH